jgi:hypothetical protein
MKGDIYYGAIELHLEHKRINKMNQVIKTDTHKFQMNDVVYTLNGDNVHITDNFNDRTHRRLPHHLQKYTIVSFKPMAGTYLGKTNYEL